MAASALVGATALYGTFVPQSRLWGSNIVRGRSTGVCLTFDDGPSPAYTSQVLQILDRLRIPATFFVIGHNVAKHPSLLKEVHAAGHLIGNHSYDHHHGGLFGSAGYWVDQLRRTDDAIAAVTAARPRFFRPPMGFKTPLMALAMRQTDHALVTWSVRGLDGVATSIGRICHRIASRTRPGSILTLHDGVDPHSSRTPEVTIRSLPVLLQQLLDSGIHFTTLEESLGLPAYVQDAVPT
jgi:peptidoglycan/xylan/chitin deacetylase (PgdA/CDA1 family)